MQWRTSQNNLGNTKLTQNRSRLTYHPFTILSVHLCLHLSNIIQQTPQYIWFLYQSGALEVWGSQKDTVIGGQTEREWVIGDLSRIFLTSELISDMELTGLVCSCSSPCTSLLPLPSEIFEENSGENIGEWRISRTHGNRLCWYQSVFLRTALWWVPRCSRCSSCSPQSSFPQSSPPPSSWWTVSAPLQPLPG